MNSLVEIGPLDLEEIFFNLSMHFSLFHFHLPLKNGMALILNKLEIPVPKDAFSPIHLKLPCGSEDEDFKIPSLYFRYFNIITPWKRA